MQFDISYVFTGPDGTRAVLGNSVAAQADSDFCGIITTRPSGLDSADVRESADNVVEGDGGVHGRFYYGRRPFTFEGRLLPGSTLNARKDKLLRAANAMQADGTLDWTETGRAQTRLWYRLQQPARIGGVEVSPTFLLAFVSANAHILSTAENSASPGSVTNAGNVPTFPKFVLTAPTNTITLTNSTTSEVLTLTGLSGAGTVTVDFAAKTVTATSGAANRYSAVSFPSSVWWQLQAGIANTVAVSGATATSGVKWRDAWL